MPLYENVDNEVTDRITRLIEDHHPHLLEAEVDVRALMATPKEKEGPPVKLHGYPCLATIKKVGLSERVQGLGDALITIDKLQWDAMSDVQRDALIDHELTHLMVKMKGKTVQRDDAGRPKLEMALHDWQLGGFAEISARYGIDAPEVRAVQVASDSFGQLFWNFDGSGGVSLGHVDDAPAKPSRRKAS